MADLLNIEGVRFVALERQIKQRRKKMKDAEFVLTAAICGLGICIALMAGLANHTDILSCPCSARRAAGITENSRLYLAGAPIFVLGVFGYLCMMAAAYIATADHAWRLMYSCLATGALLFTIFLIHRSIITEHHCIWCFFSWIVNLTLGIRELIHVIKGA